MSTKKIVLPQEIPGVKDENGAYLPIPPTPPPKPTLAEDVSIDDLLLRGLNIINRIMIVAYKEASSGDPSRNSVMNLKDCMAMLHELKKHEKELLDEMDAEQLERAAAKGE